jgi:hypothetical protein
VGAMRIGRPDDPLDYWRKALRPPPDEPPPVDGALHPTIHRTWNRIMAQGKPERADASKFLRMQFDPPVPGGTRFESSRNWSGARIVPIGGHRFHFATGTWKAPTLSPSAGPILPGLPPRCSVWIGFGAHRRWSISLPQVGTIHTAGAPDEHVPFIQWWIKDNPVSGQVVLSQPTINPGNTIVAFLWLLTPDLAAFFIVNASSAQPPVGGIMPSPDPSVVTAGVSAQWIVERPRDPPTKLRHPLPVFDLVEFSDCAAGRGLLPERLLGAGRLHRMIDVLGSPHRSRCIAKPQRRGKPRGEVQVTQR